MRKLILVCECGERMHVPRSALGKTGLCPSCARPIPIRADNTFTTGSDETAATPQTASAGRTPSNMPTEDDKRLFGEAVDLYFAKRYGEAMALFNVLDGRYPGNSEIEKGRMLCLKALQNQRTLALEDKRRRLNGKALNEDTVRRFVLDIMLNGSSETVQLQAAELACRMLGMLGDKEAPAPQETSSDGLADKLDALAEHEANPFDEAPDTRST